MSSWHGWAKTKAKWKITTPSWSNRQTKSLLSTPPTTAIEKFSSGSNLTDQRAWQPAAATTSSPSFASAQDSNISRGIQWCPGRRHVARAETVQQVKQAWVWWRPFPTELLSWRSRSRSPHHWKAKTSKQKPPPPTIHLSGKEGHCSKQMIKSCFANHVELLRMQACTQTLW